MEIGQNAPADKPAPRERDRLPNRRTSINTAFERDGSRYQMTIGHYPDGRVGEIFLNADRGDSISHIRSQMDVFGAAFLLSEPLSRYGTLH